MAGVGVRYDVVVVGAGPGGLSAAMVLGRCRRRVLLVDGGPGRNAGARGVHGFLACDGMAPEEIRSTDQLRCYPDVDSRSGRVEEIDGECGGFSVRIDDGSTADAARIVLATGLTEDLPDIAGVASRWGDGVMGCPYCHAWELRDQPLAVLATGCEEDAMSAIQVTQWSSRITFCANGTDADLALLSKHGVAVRGEEVAGVEGAGKTVEQVSFVDGRPLRCAGVFLHASTRQASSLARTRAASCSATAACGSTRRAAPAFPVCSRWAIWPDESRARRG